MMSQTCWTWERTAGLEVAGVRGRRTDVDMEGVERKASSSGAGELESLVEVVWV